MELRRRVWLAMCLVMGACESGEGSKARIEPSDVGQDQLLRWQLLREPEFLRTGGAFQGDSIHFFRIFDGAFLGNGDILITLGGEQNQVVILELDGQIKEVLGRTGDGPDEFRSAPFVLRSGDGLILIEPGAGRLRAFQGFQLAAPRRFPVSRVQSVVAVLHDGTIVTAPTGLPFGRSEHEYLVGPSTTLYELRQGDAVDTLPGPSSPPVPAFPFFTAEGNLSVFIPGKSGCLPENHFGARGSDLVIAEGHTGVVISLDRDGEADTLFVMTRRGSVTRDMVDGALAYLERVNAQSPREPFLRKVGEVGDPLPAVWSDALWEEDRVWLRHASPCFTEAAFQVWDVVDLESGTLVGVLEAPSSLQLVAVAPGRILAIETDEMGVQHLGVHRVGEASVP